MHILVGTDGSAQAISAATCALQVLAPADLLTLLAVGQIPPIATRGLESGFAGGIAEPEQVEAAYREVESEMRAALAATKVGLGGAARPHTVCERVEMGEAGALLCKLATDLKADVVVVGSRGRGVLKGALLGSVSSYVMHHATCPVLVVHG